jgi:hypothetical protein
LARSADRRRRETRPPPGGSPRFTAHCRSSCTTATAASTSRECARRPTGARERPPNEPSPSMSCRVRLRCR